MGSTTPICDEHQRTKVMVVERGYTWFDCPDCKAQEDAHRDRTMQAILDAQRRAHPAGDGGE